MKRILALLTALVTVAVITVGVNAWGFVAPQATPTLNAADSIGKRLPELEQSVTAAGFYYRASFYGITFADTRPNSGVNGIITPQTLIEAPLGGDGGYVSLLFYIYAPNDLENYILAGQTSIYPEYGEYIDLNNYLSNVVMFDGSRNYGHTVVVSDYIKSPMEGISEEMSEDEIKSVARKYNYGYVKLSQDPEWSDEYSILLSDGTWEISFNYEYYRGDIPDTAIAVICTHTCGDCSNASFSSGIDSRDGRDPRWYNWTTQYHWRECFCGQDIDYEAHEFVNSVCRVCGALKGLNQKKHTHNRNSRDYNETMHYYTCSQCDSPYFGCDYDTEPKEHYFYSDGTCGGCEYINPAYASHEHVYDNYVQDIEEDYKHNATCVICGYKKTESHNLINLQSIDFISHSGICADCGAYWVRVHDFVGNSCTECGYTYPEHECNSDAYRNIEVLNALVGVHYKCCSICGEQQSDWEECSVRWVKDENAHYAICDVCGDTFAEGAHTMLDDACIWCGYSTRPTRPGDLNNSGGKPDVSDGVIMQKMLAGLEPITSAADLDGNGVVDVSDGVAMQKILAGLS